MGRSVVLGLLAAVLLVGTALADGDPASDTLLGENVFYPYTPPVSAALQNRLNSQTASAARGGFPIKIALIESATDLGAIPALFGHPQSYAKFLDQEISFQARNQPLLVVMPAGYGTVGVPPAASAVAARLPKPGAGGSDALASAALRAVAQMASASGRPIGSAVPGGGSGGGGGASRIVIVALVVVGLAAVITVVRRNQRTPQG